MMASKALCTHAEKGEISFGENKGLEEDHQGERRSCWSWSNERHGKSAAQSINGSTSLNEHCHKDNHLGDHVGGSSSRKSNNLEFSERGVDKPLSGVRTVNNTCEQIYLHVDHDDAYNSVQLQQYMKHPRNSTIRDLYFQEQYDEDDDDDSDWEPVSPFVIKKWFCANCTMPNFDDVCHCEV